MNNQPLILASAPPPQPLLLWCPRCQAPHMDAPGTPAHCDHRCDACGHGWRPFAHATVGVAGDEHLDDGRQPVPLADAIADVRAEIPRKVTA